MSNNVNISSSSGKINIEGSIIASNNSSIESKSIPHNITSETESTASDKSIGTSTHNNHKSDSRIENVMKLIEYHERRLQKLEEQKAMFGATTNPAILIEIEDIQREVVKLRLEWKSLLNI